MVMAARCGERALPEWLQPASQRIAGRVTADCAQVGENPWWLFPRARGHAIIDSTTDHSKIMPQLIVRQVEEKIVKKLKQRAGEHGVSMEEEHRRVLREALLGRSKNKPSFKDYLLSMPNVGEDTDFERGLQIERPVEL
jgi:antitoxin FitA